MKEFLCMAHSVAMGFSSLSNFYTRPFKEMQCISNDLKRYTCANRQLMYGEWSDDDKLLSVRQC